MAACSLTPSDPHAIFDQSLGFAHSLVSLELGVVAGCLGIERSGI
jgi:hypothetical protein